jgi:hypothetical protein
MLRRLGFVSLTLFLAGCAMTALTSEVGPQEGVTYHLPKTVLKVTVTKDYFPAGPVKIEPATFYHWCPVDKPQPETKSYFFCRRGSDAMPRPPADQDGHPPVDPNRFYEYKARRLPATVDYAWYDRGGKDPVFAAFFKSEHISYSVDITPETGPDPAQRYVLQYQPNKFSHDRFCIGRDPDGLLKVVEYAGDDRTPEVLFNLVRTFTGFARLEQAAATEVSSSGIERNKVSKQIVRVIDPWRIEWKGNRLVHLDLEDLAKDTKRQFDEEITFDLTQGDDAVWGPLQHAIGERCCDPRTKQCNKACVNDKLAKVHAIRCDNNAICYRTQAKARLTISTKKQGVVQSQPVTISNQYDLGSVAVERAFLVEKITKLYFNKGSLTGLAVRKPSEAEALTLLPINAVTAALATPVGLFATAFGGDTQTKVQLAKQMGELKGSVDSLRAQPIVPPGARTTQTDDIFQIKCIAPDKGGLLFGQ